MPNVTNAYDAHKQVEDYIDDAIRALEDAENTLSKINYDDVESIQGEVDSALSEIENALHSLRG